MRSSRLGATQAGGGTNDHRVNINIMFLEKFLQAGVLNSLC